MRKKKHTKNHITKKPKTSCHLYTTPRILLQKKNLPTPTVCPSQKTSSAIKPQHLATAFEGNAVATSRLSHRAEKRRANPRLAASAGRRPRVSSPWRRSCALARRLPEPTRPSRPPNSPRSRRQRRPRRAPRRAKTRVFRLSFGLWTAARSWIDPQRRLQLIVGRLATRSSAGGPRACPWTASRLLLMLELMLALLPSAWPWIARCSGGSTT